MFYCCVKQLLEEFSHRPKIQTSWKFIMTQKSYYFCITLPLRDEKNSLTSESFPLSVMPKTLLKMKAVPRNAVFCKQLITMGIPIIFRWFSCSSVTAPKAPIAVGITVALTSLNFCTCNLKSWCLFFFSVSLGIAMLMILHSLSSLSVTAISDFGGSIFLSVWIPKS